MADQRRYAIHQHPRQAAGAIAPARGAAPLEYSLRPRLTAIAPTTAEVVQRAGGWLFDQAMSGWDVTVITADQGDPRPLLILGVRVCDLETLLAALASRVVGACLAAVAVRTDLYDADERVRRVVRTAGTANAEIRLWGDARPADLEPAAHGVSHRLSLAARAFKAEALAAAGIPPDQAAPAEEFRRGAYRRPALVPAP